jgi:TolB-like protein/tetratricopeptide (TPR) repeat protein
MTEESLNQTSGSDVFVSYASQDASVANSIVESLEAQGLRCWIAPRDVKPGAQYADAIVRAINEAKALVLVMSGSAVDSAHVAREVERAASKRKPIIPFRIDAAPLNPELEYFLSNAQWIEVPKLGMSAALARLKEAVGEGSASSPHQTAPQRPIRGIGRRVVLPGAIVIALGLLIAVGVHFWGSKQGAQAPAVAGITDKSIAVLPFVDMSEKKDQEYFGDGMAEEIIDLLVKIPGLKVIGRTSSFQFKGKTEDLRTIGTQLGVAYVLEGSVRKSGDRLRVTAQLINSRDGTHLLSQTYDRDLRDVLKTQDEIAIKVARALETEVLTRDFISRPALRNTEAYTLYLQGQHAGDRFEPQGWEQAVNDFKRAFDLDPSFTEAAAAVAGFSQYGGQVGYIPPDVAFEQARQFAELALKLDPNFVSAHAVLGSIYGSYAWDWPAADKEIKVALGLAPNDSETLWAATVLSLTLGRWDDGVRYAITMQEVDPLNPNGYFWLSLGQMRRGRFAEAEAAILRALELSPTYTFGPYTLGLILLARNQAEAALAAFLKEPRDASRIGGSALAYFALGRKAESDAALALRIKDYGNFAIGIAKIYAFRGESDEAFKWLDRAYERKDALLYGIKFAPEFDKLHGDPRYKAFLKKMNLPE